MANTAVLVADGFEEIEAVTVIDVLRRAGHQVIVAGVGGGRVATGSHGIVIGIDAGVDSLDADGLDLVVLPGGMPGAKNLAADPKVITLLQSVHQLGGRVAAICAAPLVLHAAGLLHRRRVTCYPAFNDQLGDVQYTGAAVETDERIVTGKGAGTAMAFALELVAQLDNPAAATELAAVLQYQN